MSAQATRPRVLSTRALSPAIAAALDQRFALRIAPAPLTEVIAQALRDFDPHAVIARDDLPVDACALAPSLLHVARHGVGLDVIPMAACARHGVTVSNVPGGNATSVAEWCVAQILALLHSLPQIGASMRSQGWAATRAAFSGRALDLAGRQVGLIGCGAIGTALGTMLHAGLGARVAAHTRTPARLPGFVQPMDFDACVAGADVLVPCVPLTDQTRGLISAQAIATMKPGALFVNASRGEVVDEAALVAALLSGRLGGAALDVITDRQGRQGTGLPELPNLVVTPHLAGHTADAAERNGRSVIEALDAVLLAGQRPRHLVDETAWAPMLARRARLLGAG